MRFHRGVLGVAGLLVLAAGLTVVMALRAHRVGQAPAAVAPSAPSGTGSATSQVFRIEPPVPAHDFELIDQHGRPFRLRAQRGHPVLLFFGYTHCPDVCPTTLVTFKAVKDQLGSLAQEVRLVFITVDPERDTPQRLKEYVGYYDPDIVALWGTPEQIQAVRTAYGIVAEKQPQEGAPGGYWVVHTASALLVDPQGRLRAMYPFGTSAQQMAADLRALLQ